MAFPSVEYIEWIAGRPDEATHDLATTGLRGRHDSTQVDSEGAIDAVRSPRDTTRSVERLLAEAYGVDESAVVVTAGATEANFLALASLVEDGDRVLVERPGYEAHWKTPVGLGASVDRFDRTPETDYRLDPERIADAVTPDTAAVVVSNRHNPSGRRTDRETLHRVAEAADTPLLVDEVCASYVRSPASGRGFGGPTAAGLDDTIVTGSLSKFFGYRELRLGWLIADLDIADAVRATKIHLGGTSELSRRYAAAVLSTIQSLSAADPASDQDEAARSRALYSDHTTRLSAFLDSRSDLSVPGTVQTSYAFPAHDRASGSEVAAAAADAGILVVPGRFFGDDDRFRIGLGKSPGDMDAALDALGTVLDGL